MDIYITARIPRKAIDFLKDRGLTVEVDDFPDRDRLLEKVKDAGGVITMLSDRVDKEFIDRAENLKIVANYAVGYNNIDWEYARNTGVAVSNTPGVLTDATADLTWALILAVARKIIPADSYTREGKFSGWEPLSFLGSNLKNKNLGILGMGRIGRAVAKRGRAFNMNIIYHNRNPVGDEIEESLEAEYLTFEELLKQSDILTLHIPLTEETEDMIGESELELMKKDAYLINTARGAVIDEEALLEALREEALEGAGLDVYRNEPDFDPGFCELDSVVLLPHLGSATRETRTKMAMMAAENVVSVLEGGEPINPVPN